MGSYMFEFLLNLFGSALVGFVLWLALPRGIALIPQNFGEDAHGGFAPDTWCVMNSSPHQIQLLRIRTGRWDAYGNIWKKIKLTDEEALLGLQTMTSTNLTSGMLVHREKKWKEVIINPGVKVSFHVEVHTDLEIIYRRKGMFGFFERRKLLLKGCA